MKLNLIRKAAAQECVMNVWRRLKSALAGVLVAYSLFSVFALSFGLTSVALHCLTVGVGASLVDDSAISATWDADVTRALPRQYASLSAHASSSLTSGVLGGRVRMGVLADSRGREAFAQVLAPDQFGRRSCFISLGNINYISTFLPSASVAHSATETEFRAKVLDALAQMVVLHEASHCEGYAIFDNPQHPLAVATGSQRVLDSLTHAMEPAQRQLDSNLSRIVYALPRNACLDEPLDARAAATSLFQERFADVRGLLLLARLWAKELGVWEEAAHLFWRYRVVESAREYDCLFNDHDTSSAVVDAMDKVSLAMGWGGVGLAGLVGTSDADDARVTELAARIALDSMRRDQVRTVRRFIFAASRTWTSASSFEWRPGVGS